MKVLCDVDENQRSLPKYSVNRQNNYGSPWAFIYLHVYSYLRYSAVKGGQLATGIDIFLISPSIVE